MVCRPRSSLREHTQPCGLWSATYTLRLIRTSLPSTITSSRPGSTFDPSCVTRLPLTLTRPVTIKSSLARREATPASARNFWRRTVTWGRWAAVGTQNDKTRQHGVAMLRVWNSGCSLYRGLGLAEPGDAGAFLPFAGFAKEFEA